MTKPPAGKPKRKVGRPFIPYDAKIAERILDAIADGKSLRQAVKAKGMPSRPTVRKWMRQNDEFSAAFARAREESGHSHADKVIDLADATTPQNAHARKVQIQARQWTAGVNNAQYKENPSSAVQVNVGAAVKPAMDRDEMILEAARGVGWLLAHADHVMRERAEALALPAPAPMPAEETHSAALPSGNAPDVAPTHKLTPEETQEQADHQAELEAAEKVALEDAEREARRELNRRGRGAPAEQIRQRRLYSRRPRG